MHISLRQCAPALVLAVLILLSGCSTATENVRDDSGAIAESNENASVFDMKEGDCFNDPGDDPDEVETLPAVPCSQDHDYEVFEVYTFDDDEFPGDATVSSTADDVCAAEFKQYVGVAFDDSALDLSYLFPNAQSWDQGDREVTCLVYDPNQATSGTLQGAER